MRQVLLIEAVARLMQDAHERGEELVRPVARRHAHVGGNAAAERVVRHVEPPVVKVEAHRLHQFEAQRLLLLGGEGAIEGLQRMLFPPPRLRLQRLRNEPREEGLEVGEDPRNLGGAAARVILLHHCVIGRKLQHLGPALCFLAGQRHDVLEAGEEVLPVILRPQNPPQLLAAQPGAHLAGHEVGRQAGAVDVGALELRHRGFLRGIEVFLLGRANPVGNLRRCRHFMRHGGKNAHRLRALFAAAVRHVHGLVHAQHGLRVVDGFETAAEVIEFSEGHQRFAFSM